MNDLIDRYVHQVGLYVRPKERADIEAELRSQIHDRLEALSDGGPAEADVAAMLKELGDPHTLAASYSSDQYLVGPALYPFMMTVLRFGLVLIPAVVIITNLAGAALAPEGADWPRLLLETASTAIQAALLFLAVVVVFFAILQRTGERFPAAEGEFDPLKLPKVDDPRAVDRLESGFGLAIGAVFGLALLYFLQVGGLTLRFTPGDPGGVIPAPAGWLIALLITIAGVCALNLWALVRRRWTFGMWLAQAVLELIGAIGLYFALFTPVAEHFLRTAPEWSAGLPLAELPWIITLLNIVFIVLRNGSRLIRLWQHQQGTAA